MTTSKNKALSSKEKEQNHLNACSAAVQEAWGVATDNAIPNAHNLRQADRSPLGNNYVKALAALADKVPELAAAQKLMKEQRDRRVVREVDKQGRQAPHLTVNDLQEIIRVCDKKEEEEDRMGVREAFGLRKVRKPSLKAAEIAEGKKRQKTDIVGQDDTVNDQQRSASVEPAEDKPEEPQVQETEQNQASATAPGETEHNVNVNADDSPQIMAPPGNAPTVIEEDLDVEHLLAQYGLLDTDERSLIIGLRAYTVNLLTNLRAFTGSRTDLSSRMHLERAGGQLEWSLMGAFNAYEEVLDRVDPVETNAEPSESSNGMSEEELSENTEENYRRMVQEKI